MYKKKFSSYTFFFLFLTANKFNYKLLSLGGFASENSEDFGNITKKVICYDILNEMWCNKASMNNSRAFHSAVIFNDEIWVVGGRDQSGK